MKATRETNQRVRSARFQRQVSPLRSSRRLDVFPLSRRLRVEQPNSSCRFLRVSAGDDAALTQSIADVISSKSMTIGATNQPHGVSVMANRLVEDFRDDEDIRKAGLIVKREHPDFGQAEHPGSVAKLSETPMRVGRPTPLLGAETDDILSEAGYTGEQIESMKLSGAVVQRQA
ncbi:MAG: hypothetical protein Ct9H300mP11_28940 [Chloroflexota bacterium]|nr:MAG: hypothetical protein Ct9H300mP11_28940 [Chloroflexota bacterium]